MSVQFDTRQAEHKASISQLGTGANVTLQTITDNAESQLAKLYEDRNIVLADGGTITYSAGSLSVTSTFKLHINSKVAGGAPTVIPISGASFAFGANGRMLYVLVNRGAGTATVFADQTSLPAVIAANTEVFLIAKRIDLASARVYLCNGQSLADGESALLGSAPAATSFSDANFEVYNDAIATKKIKFDASGITAATTRTYTWKDASGTIPLENTRNDFTHLGTGFDYAQAFGSGHAYKGKVRFRFGSYTETETWVGRLATVMPAIGIESTSGRQSIRITHNNSSLNSSPANYTDGAFVWIHPFDAANGAAAYRVFRIITGTESGANDTPAATLTDRFYIQKNGRVYAGTGGAANPSYGFVDSLNTGMYTTAGSNAIYFSASGTLSLTVTEVGITTNSYVRRGSQIISYPSTAAYSVTIDDHEKYILCGNTTKTINLPAHGSVFNGFTVTIKDYSGNATASPITLVRSGGVGKIEGLTASYGIQGNNQSVVLVSDGVDDWWIVSYS